MYIFLTKKLSHLFTNWKYKKTSPKAGSCKLNSLEGNYSHSIVNKTFLSFIFNGLFFC